MLNIKSIWRLPITWCLRCEKINSPIIVTSLYKLNVCLLTLADLVVSISLSDLKRKITDLTSGEYVQKVLEKPTDDS